MLETVRPFGSGCGAAWRLGGPLGGLIDPASVSYDEERPVRSRPYASRTALFRVDADRGAERVAAVAEQEGAVLSEACSHSALTGDVLVVRSGASRRRVRPLASPLGNAERRKVAVRLEREASVTVPARMESPVFQRRDRRVASLELL